MPTDRPPPRSTERKALLLAVLTVVVLVVLFFTVDWGLDTAPTVSEGGEEPGTVAPYGVEPPEPMTD